jgi:geranylgeranylglycerol-phosphate geranylgeranyltransferase
MVNRQNKLISLVKNSAFESRLGTHYLIRYHALTHLICMCASFIENRKNEQNWVDSLTPHEVRSAVSSRIARFENTRQAQRAAASGNSIRVILRSQLILFTSRMKWGLLFALATAAGIFCVPIGSNLILSNFSLSLDGIFLILKTVLLPICTLLIITGMYVLNDLIDADLDRMNRKFKRPIPSRKVPKRHALIFVVGMNLIGISIPVLINSTLGILAASTIALIGILYSIPKISLKDKFIIKTIAIPIIMMCSLLLGSGIRLDKYLVIGINGLIFDNYHSTAKMLLLLPMFSGIALALMVFVTSPLNDLGDIEGDKASGRRTIPIVIGRENTIKLSVLVALGIAVSSLKFQQLGTRK